MKKLMKKVYARQTTWVNVFLFFATIAAVTALLLVLFVFAVGVSG